MKSPLRSLKQSQEGAARGVVFALGVALVGIWAMSVYANYAVREGMQRTLSRQQLSTASIVAAQVHDELQHRINLLTTVAARLGAHSQHDAADTQTFLSDYPMLQDDFNGGIFVTDANGVAIADFPVVAGRVGTHYMDRDSVRIPLTQGIPIVGKPNMGKTLKAPIFSIVVPIRNSRQAVIGSIVGTINLGLPNFLDKVSNGRYGKTGGYFVIAPQYRLVVTALDKSRLMEELAPVGAMPAIDRLLVDRDFTEVFVNSRGVEVLSAAVTIRASGWRLVVSVPTDEAFAPIRELQWRVWLAAATATILGIVATAWLLKSQRSAEMALYDPLTLLPNRRLLLDRLGQAMAGSQRLSHYFAVMVLDLDNFKPLNDRHGHLLGDELLVEAANRLKHSVRDIDTVARFGGDEFVVVLSDVGVQSDAATAQGCAIAEKIRLALGEPYQLPVMQKGKLGGIVQHRCTVTIGVALGNGHQIEPMDILTQADAAMYRAKAAGRNQVMMAQGAATAR